MDKCAWQCNKLGRREFATMREFERMQIAGQVAHHVWLYSHVFKYEGRKRSRQISIHVFLQLVRCVRVLCSFQVTM